jgi:hypothetical protein
MLAYSAEDDRLFRRNVTGYSAGSALAVVSTLVGHDQSRFRCFRWFVTERVGLGLGPSFSGFPGRFALAHRLLGFEMDSM